MSSEKKLDGQPASNMNGLDEYRPPTAGTAMLPLEISKIKKMILSGLSDIEIAKELEKSKEQVKEVRSGRCFAWVSPRIS
ncbi:hypothetical protein RJ527_11630 [Thalassospiraceae bacterium LMO-SO8]|nr:hypothetical protein [Alphaproteobacteria bacterium LMO-S08]WND74691.1 hypothetical protein RJ527_11630 [Thalassospiraceae bacterium LMO-SO8]